MSRSASIRPASAAPTSTSTRGTSPRSSRSCRATRSSARSSRPATTSTAFEPGQWVTINPNMSCGRCDQCRRGRQLLCRNLTGIGSNSDGGFAELITVPGRRRLRRRRPRRGRRGLRRADRMRAARPRDAAATARQHRAGPRLRRDRAAPGPAARLRRCGARDRRLAPGEPARACARVRDRLHRPDRARLPRGQRAQALRAVRGRLRLRGRGDGLGARRRASASASPGTAAP